MNSRLQSVVAKIQKARAAAGFFMDWKKVPAKRKGLTSVKPGETLLCLDGPTQGISRFQGLQKLWVLSPVNSHAIEEIAQIRTLEFLYLQRMNADDLAPLAALENLTSLLMLNGTKITDLSPLQKLSRLESLDLFNFKKCKDLEPLGEMTSLKALAVEGGMSNIVEVETLHPLSRLQRLTYLSLIALKSKDESLKPLAALPHLQYLECTKRWPPAEFEALRAALPRLKCTWFEMEKTS
jgi:Leucine-rich repeat (LRR) protein